MSHSPKILFFFVRENFSFQFRSCFSLKKSSAARQENMPTSETFQQRRRRMTKENISAGKTIGRIFQNQRISELIIIIINLLEYLQ